MKKIFYLPMLLLLLSNCRQNSALEGFDSNIWRNDPMGCQNKRADQADDFLKIVKPHLLQNALREMEVRALLGKADAIEIAERGMKFYKYYLDKGRQCARDASGRQGRYIQIRFNALNKVNEVALITPNS